MHVAEAIIFDCFGVFVDSNFRSFCRKYAGGNSEKIEEITALDEQACLGKITHEQFIWEVSKICTISTGEASRIINRSPANTDLFKYIHDNLSPRYKLGLLSNASCDWLGELFTTEQLRLFKDKLLSFEVGLVKPGTKIFESAAERLGVTPSKCVFIDDSADNCEGG